MGNRLANIRSVRTKILAGFVAVVALTAVLGISALRDMSTINRATSSMYEENVLPISELGTIQKHIYRARVYLLTELVADGEEAEVAAEKLVESRDAVAESLEAYKASDLTGREEALAAFERGWARELHRRAS